MKTNYSLILLLFITFQGFSQFLYDFNNSDNGWSFINTTGVATATYYELTVLENKGNLQFTSPTVSIETATSGAILAVTIQNLSSNGPGFFRIGLNGVLRNTPSTNISKSDTGFKTYYLDLSTHSEWTGTITEISLQFKELVSQNYNSGMGGQKIYIDKIELLNTIPTIERQAYHFNTDGDTEGWSAVLGSANVTNGNLILNPESVGVNTRIELGTYHVNADNASTLTLTLKNNSTGDNHIHVVSSAAAGTIVIPISNQDTDHKTYIVDMSTLPNWSGEINDIKFFVRDGNLSTNRTSATGSLEFNSIVFDNTEVLSVLDFDNSMQNMSLYVNPTNYDLTINYSESIQEIKIFNISGQLVLSCIKDKKINVSSLSKGVYIANVNSNGKYISKKFLKE